MKSYTVVTGALVVTVLLAVAGCGEPDTSTVDDDVVDACAAVTAESDRLFADAGSDADVVERLDDKWRRDGGLDPADHALRSRKQAAIDETLEVAAFLLIDNRDCYSATEVAQARAYLNGLE